MVENTGVVIVTFIIYLLVMLGLGLVAYLRTQNLSDYILGGRNLGPIPSALSAGASDMSGWLLMGLPGFAYAAGLQATWIAVGLLIGTWANWLLVARRLRNYSAAAKDSLTIPSFLENRFRDNSRILRVIAAFSYCFSFSSIRAPGLWLAASCSRPSSRCPTSGRLSSALLPSSPTPCLVAFLLYPGRMLSRD